LAFLFRESFLAFFLNCLALPFSFLSN